MQQAEHVVRLLGPEDVVVALHDDAHASAGERPLHIVDVTALLHEDRNVAGLDGAKSNGLRHGLLRLAVLDFDHDRADHMVVGTCGDRSPAVAPERDESGDVVGNRAGRRNVHRVLALKPFLGVPDFKYVRLAPDPILVEQEEARAVDLRIDGLVGEVVAQEGVGARDREEPVDRLDELRAGAEVASEAAVATDELARTHVGVEVGRAEAVDGLLRVAHEEERAGLVRRALALRDLEEELPEDGKLHGVRVLELVDQHAPVSVPDAGHKGARGIVAQREPHLGEQVVVGREPPGALEGAKRRRRGADEALEPFAGQRLDIVGNDALCQIFGQAGQRSELFRPVVALHKQATLVGRRAGVEFASQEGLRHLVAQGCVVVRELRIEVPRRREDVFGEHLLAEAVNRVDGRVVKARKRFAQALDGILVADGHATPDLHLPHDEGIDVLGGVDARQIAVRLGKMLADAALELRRGRLREGHDEKTVDRDLLLDDQPEHQMLDREGLARARRRLKKRRNGEVGLLHHEAVAVGGLHGEGLLMLRFGRGSVVEEIVGDAGFLRSRAVLDVRTRRHIVAVLGHGVAGGRSVAVIEFRKRRHRFETGIRVFSHLAGHPASVQPWP